MYYATGIDARQSKVFKDLISHLRLGTDTRFLSNHCLQKHLVNSYDQDFTEFSWGQVPGYGIPALFPHSEYGQYLFPNHKPDNLNELKGLKHRLFL